MTVVPDVRWVEGAVHALAAAEIARALRARPAPRFAVPGGRSAAAVFDALVALPPLDRPDWTAAHLFFVDERAVPPTEAESNYRLARERLVEPAGIREHHVHRMRGEDPDLDRAARDYQAELGGTLDVVLLGIGEDGHVASLFPGSALLRERERRVAAVHDSPKPPPRRLTLTPRALDEAGTLIVIAEGGAKRDAVMRAIAGEGSVDETPARLARRGLWFIGGMGPPPLRPG